eukprot:3692800-Pleurochrysis_carterae.AAC.2
MAKCMQTGSNLQIQAVHRGREYGCNLRSSKLHEHMALLFSDERQFGGGGEPIGHVKMRERIGEWWQRRAGVEKVGRGGGSRPGGIDDGGGVWTGSREWKGGSSCCGDGSGGRKWALRVPGESESRGGRMEAGVPRSRRSRLCT